MPIKFKAGFADFDPAAVASNLPEPLQWTGGALLGGLKSALGLVGGDTPETSASATLGAPMMAAGESELTPIAKKAGDVLKGLYSRVGRVAEGLPAMSHPNKVLSLLKNNANAEEVNYRGLGDFLKGKGNEMVPKEEILSHLEQNPAPEINLIQKRSGPRNTKPIETMHPDEYNQYMENLTGSNAPKYGSFQLPGGENYTENLFQLKKGEPKMVPTGSTTSDVMIPKSSVGDLAGSPYPTNNYDPETGEELARGIYNTNQVYHNSPEYVQEYAQKYNGLVMHSTPEMEPEQGAFYDGPHWNDENVLVHSRTQDRRLNPASEWSPEHFSGGEDMSGLPMYYPEEEGPTVDKDFKFFSPQGTEIHGFGTNRDEAVRQLIDDLKGPNSYASSTLSGELPPSTGPKIRNIENIQSDWHQTGAKHGYGPEGVNQEDLEMLRRATEDRDRAYDFLQGLKDQYSGMDTDEFYAHPTASRDIEEAQRAYDNARNVFMSAAAIMPNPEGVPNAPFKNSWLDLGLKHQLLDVANNPDIQGISVTPGAELMKRGEGQSPQMNDQTIPNALKRLLKPFGGGEPEMTKIAEGKPPLVNWHGAERWSQGTEPFEGSRHGGLFNPDTGQDVLSGLLDEDYNGNLFRPARGMNVDSRKLINYFDKYNKKPIEAPLFRITPEMKAQIKAKGLPLLALMGLVNSQPKNIEEQ